MTYPYRAYGLTLGCDTRVSALRQERTEPERFDIAVSLGPETDWVREARRLPSRLEHPRPGEVERDNSPFTLTSFGSGEFFELAYGNEALFFVDGAAERLWGTCLPPLTSEDVATYLLGPVMGFVLRRRNVLALHASAVCIGGQAVVLCGESQAGKSTTAAALALQGIAVLCEDVTPLIEVDRRFQVEPGYPRVCLWPDAVEKLFGARDALPRLTPSWEKFFLPLDGGNAKFEEQRQVVSTVYVFAPRVAQANAPRIETMSAREALLDLVQNSYMNWLLDRRQRAAEFDALSKLVTQVPIRRIVPHLDPGRIGALCELIVADAERVSSACGSAARVTAR
ncbi:MAG: hypothetical protein DMG44_15525 [Acidobacteria bacterium]|nr:MAG: hypothetical protein DMG44_15525 [Acidobacteriota bacterium]